MTADTTKAAVVDYGLGNLFSIQQACRYAGIEAEVTSSKQSILAADLVLLPGIGAYRDAMAALYKLDLVRPLQDLSAQEKPLVGICLGMQLLMTVSYEFGEWAGLDIVKGTVEQFRDPKGKIGLDGAETVRPLKVPQIGWNRLCYPPNQREGNNPWEHTGLMGLEEGDYMYFVHSYYVKPENADVVLSTSDYGGIKFCSSLKQENIFACQFHPERSGPKGLKIYENIAKLVREVKQRSSS